MRALSLTFWVAALACTACGSGSSGSGSGASDRSHGSTSAAGASASQPSSGTGGMTLDVANSVPKAMLFDGGHGICGNGVVTRDEACDDGNTASGDGCSSDCLEIEIGYSCTPPGKPCRQIAHCGDGVVAPTEACDDGNTKDGDGCSARCKIENGFECDGAPSTCTATKCGDGKQEGIEACDDGNDVPFDGCGENCQAEPNCSAGACTSRCGDGLVLNEDCDDGNTKDGDGCSHDCKVEPGFTCTTSSTCDMEDGHCVLHVPAIFRDFDMSHPDFGIGCGMLVKGVVKDMLNADGKPVLADGSKVCIQSADTFNQWYTSNAQNATIVGGITLYDNGKGGFVNRWGPHGEQWAGPVMYTNTVYGGPGGTGCGMCTPSATGMCLDPCTPWNSSQACCSDSSQMFYDGNPLFFPIDDAPNALTDPRFKAEIPEQYGYNGWPQEDTVIPNAPAHDFSFTTEVVYWFQYQAGTSAVLDFLGDDDVWVFVNRQLAVDLGGPHVPTGGSVTIDATSAAQFGLSTGNVYEIHVFHAERKLYGSSFKLTLTGFNTSPSDCTPICGDGIVTAGEECDDGINDGGYEECGAGCVLGPHCGDGIVQPGEDCDDGNRRDGDGCGSSCRNLTVF